MKARIFAALLIAAASFGARADTTYNVTDANGNRTKLTTAGSSTKLPTLTGTFTSGHVPCLADSSGTLADCGNSLPSNSLPLPSPTVKGVVNSKAVVSNEFLNSLGLDGVFTSRRPSCADISDASAACPVDTRNADNLNAGTVPPARLPSPTSSTFGGVKSKAATAHDFVTGIGTDGIPTARTPAADDVTGLGNAATKNVGTTAGTVAAGDDSRVVGAEQAANKNAANGYAGLDGSSKLPGSRIAAGSVDLGALANQVAYSLLCNPTSGSGPIQPCTALPPGIIPSIAFLGSGDGIAITAPDNSVVADFIANSNATDHFTFQNNPSPQGASAYCNNGTLTGDVPCIFATQGFASHFFGTGGGVQLEIADSGATAETTIWPILSGGTATQPPKLVSLGDFDYRLPLTFTHRFKVNGNTVLAVEEFGTTAGTTPTNYLSIKNGYTDALVHLEFTNDITNAADPAYFASSFFRAKDVGQHTFANTASGNLLTISGPASNLTTDKYLRIRAGDATDPIKLIGANGAANIAVGSGLLSRGAVRGFPLIPVMSGTPTGTIDHTGTSNDAGVPLVYDSNNGGLWTNYGGVWTQLNATGGGFSGSANDLADLAAKPSVDLLADTNITLSGTQVIDGTTCTANSTTVLATAQTTGSENGPWLCQSGSWTRPAWYASGNTTQAFYLIRTFIRSGFTNKGETWHQTTGGTLTVDTSATTWAKVTPQIKAGGTGATSFTTHGVVTANSSTALGSTAAMTDGQMLVGQTGADPQAKTMTGDCTLAASGAITCTASGTTPSSSFGSLPSAASNTGKSYMVTDARSTYWISDGTHWKPGSGCAVIYQNEGTLAAPIATISGATTAAQFSISGGDPQIPAAMLVAGSSRIRASALVRKNNANAAWDFQLKLGTSDSVSDNNLVGFAALNSAANRQFWAFQEASVGGATTYTPVNFLNANGQNTASAADRTTNFNVASINYVSAHVANVSASDTFDLVSLNVEVCP